ncbi:MAG: hypothetical protein IJK99_03150, partial [Bacteroidales bacterium]|nr:hypothetical protein [Bacteroidales bacterium]
AILNLGIDRSLTGDILIRGKTAWLICLQNIADFLTDSLTRIRRTPVRMTVPKGPVEALEPVLEPVSLNVSSERLDVLLAAGAHVGMHKGRVDISRYERLAAAAVVHRHVAKLRATRGQHTGQIQHAVHQAD